MLRIESQADFQAIAPAAPGILADVRHHPLAVELPQPFYLPAGAGVVAQVVQGEDFPQGFEGARTFHQREVVEGQLRDQSPARLAVQARLALRAGRVAQACGGDRPGPFEAQRGAGTQALGQIAIGA